MKRSEIKNNINSLNENMINGSFDNVLLKMKKKEGVLLKMSNQKEKKYFKGVLASALCAFVICFGLLVFFKLNKTIVATINFDVNPSIELKINSKNIVKSVKAYNQEGKDIINKMDLEGVDLEVATNAIIGSLYKNGYINNENNSILVSVIDSKDQTYTKQLTQTINKYLDSNNVKASIVTQNIDSNKDIENLASKYNISIGKAKLINKLIETNPLYEFDALSKLNTNELNLLISSNNKVVDVNTNGVASTSKYVSKDKVKSIVFNHANVKESEVKNLKIEIDYDNKGIVYDIEFIQGQYEYDYDVDAISGKIIKFDKDLLDYEDRFIDDSKSVNNNYITKQEAKNIAFAKAGIKEAISYDIEFEYKSSIAVYEIEFETKEYEFEVIINAKTGTILYYEKEKNDDFYESKKSNVTNNNSNKQTNNNYISASKAKSIALTQAGVSSYSDYEIEMDNENGTMVYEISFETKTHEYEYKINAITGKIIEREVDVRD